MLGLFVGGALLLVAVVLTGVLAADVALDLAQGATRSCVFIFLDHNHFLIS